MRIIFYSLFFLTTICSLTRAAEVKTNQVLMTEAPTWVTKERVDKVVEHIQPLMEWDIRRVTVRWYKNQDEFENVHGYGPSVIAVSKPAENTIHMGPNVTSDIFDGVFGHELVHIISFQKYKGIIPKWLEEGLANFFSQRAKVDYAWLNHQPIPDDVRTLTHPYSGTAESTRYHYMASQALAEMINSKCDDDMTGLLRLAIQRDFERKLDTHCDIKNINDEYREWLKSHST